MFRNLSFVHFEYLCYHNRFLDFLILKLLFLLNANSSIIYLTLSLAYVNIIIILIISNTFIIIMFFCTFTLQPIFYIHTYIHLYCLLNITEYIFLTISISISIGSSIFTPAFCFLTLVVEPLFSLFPCYVKAKEANMDNTWCYRLEKRRPTREVR